jgi:hypothetical protein
VICCWTHFLLKSGWLLRGSRLCLTYRTSRSFLSTTLILGRATVQGRPLIQRSPGSKLTSDQLRSSRAGSHNGARTRCLLGWTGARISPCRCAMVAACRPAVTRCSTLLRAWSVDMAAGTSHSTKSLPRPSPGTVSSRSRPCAPTWCADVRGYSGSSRVAVTRARPGWAGRLPSPLTLCSLEECALLRRMGAER